jgi:hypothetical protein
LQAVVCLQYAASFSTLLKLVVIIVESYQNQSVGSQVSKLTTILFKQGMVLMQIALKDG